MWSADINRPGTSLRSTVLEPCIFHSGYVDVVHSVLETRDWHVPVDVSLEGAPPLFGGKLLVYFPEETLSDGAAEGESQGLFDVFNVPPWDTWVGIFEDDHHAILFPNRALPSRYLLSWIPPSFVRLASNGIEVNPEQCITWLNDSEVAIRDMLLKGTG